MAESYLVYSQIPPTKLGLKILYSLVVVYGLWTLFIGIYVGHWIYPFYNVLNWPQRAAVMLVIASYFSVFYFGGVKLHQLFWPSNRVKKLRAKVK